ncbi:MAG TPA: cytochrome c oxidase assembly protein [Microlunatus sp.]
MVDLHATHGSGWSSWAGALLPFGAILAYLAVVAISDRPWPRRRTAMWLAGNVTAAAALGGPLAAAADGDFVAHAVTHLLLGMIAPLLLVLGAPITLVLRAAPVGRARHVSRMLRSPPLRILTEPTVAATLSVGGLWLLYTTELYAVAQRMPAVHLLVHVHMFLAGYLFTVIMISVDPLPHRRGHLHRSVVLVLALAGHDVLAKFLYAHPPTGVPGPEAETGAMIMYYGGDLVDVVLMIIICAQWFRVRGRRPRALPTLLPGRAT